MVGREWLPKKLLLFYFLFCFYKRKITNKWRGSSGHGGVAGNKQTTQQEEKKEESKCERGGTLKISWRYRLIMCRLVVPGCIITESGQTDPGTFILRLRTNGLSVFAHQGVDLTISGNTGSHCGSHQAIVLCLLLYLLMQNFFFSFSLPVLGTLHTQTNKQPTGLLWLFSLLDVWIGDGLVVRQLCLSVWTQEKERKPFRVSSTWDFLAVPAGLQLTGKKKKVPTRGANWANNWQTLENVRRCRAPAETHTNWWWCWMDHWLIIVRYGRPYQCYSRISRLK